MKSSRCLFYDESAVSVSLVIMVIMTVQCSFFSQSHLQDEIRGKKPYTPVKSTVEPKKLKLDGNSGKENQEPKSKENPGKEFDDKENEGTENIAKVNFENEKTCREGGQKSKTRSLCSVKDNASKMPLESQDTNVKAP